VKLDDNAAAFGLFQLTYADVEQQFAGAVFFIRRIKEPDLKFEDVFKLSFSELRKSLKKELKQFEGQSSHEMELHDLRSACAKAEALAKWRNPRAHPRVRVDENGITIYDWRTLKPLTIDRDECVEKIEEAAAITASVAFNVGQILRDLESQKEIDKKLDEIFKIFQDQDG
jgi:hypothetical protein